MDSSRPIQVLVIEDSQFIYKAVKSLLGKERNFTYHTSWADSLGKGLDIFAEQDFDLILSSLCLPDSPNGHETIQRICGAFNDQALIVLTSSDDEQLPLQALRSGAQDYLNKDSISDTGSLARSIRYAIERKRNESERRRLINELSQATAELTENNQRYQRNLQSAALVQQSLLPDKELEWPQGLHCYWAFDPCDELAGDLLNIIPIDDHRISFYILDVSGHGLASALLGMQVNQAIMQNNKRLLIDRDGRVRRPDEVLLQLNDEFQMKKPMLLFFTMTYAIIDTQKKELSFSSGGHPAPFIHKAEGHVVIPEHNGLPIGMMPDTSYVESIVPIADGDRIFLCSDGLYECTNANDEEFSRRRLVEHIQSNHAYSLNDCIDDIMQTARTWHEPGPKQDDGSLLGIEFISND